MSSSNTPKFNGLADAMIEHHRLESQGYELAMREQGFGNWDGNKSVSNTQRFTLFADSIIGAARNTIAT